MCDFVSSIFILLYYLEEFYNHEYSNCQSFYNKIENKLKNKEFELSQAETAAIWKKIEAAVPKPTV